MALIPIQKGGISNDISSWDIRSSGNSIPATNAGSLHNSCCCACGKGYDKLEKKGPGILPGLFLFAKILGISYNLSLEIKNGTNKFIARNIF